MPFCIHEKNVTGSIVHRPKIYKELHHLLLPIHTQTDISNPNIQLSSHVARHPTFYCKRIENLRKHLECLQFNTLNLFGSLTLHNLFYLKHTHTHSHSHRAEHNCMFGLQKPSIHVYGSLYGCEILF